MSRRRLSPDERSLWRDVARSVTPLPKRRVEDLDDTAHAAPLPDKPKLKSNPDKTKSRTAAAVLPLPAAPVTPPPRQEPAPLGRKARRRLARGSDAIDGRLDLHGMTQAQAHDALLRFLRRSREHGARVVLVITGKGGRGAQGEGVLKRQVPMWLRLPEFRDCVVGSDPAGIGHGGEGAMYIRVRRVRGSD
jgi:DNA-nicking Smr family endonuclease